ncbi:putative UPF0157 protein YqkA [Lipomyces chichibuensis]|uniref:putative UPF0157 protein YqkA n=1 Tax=Lipomyces chichibuensis TaxID=1546026 RepID=UPI00334332DB
MPIIIEPHNPAWIIEFNNAKSTLEEILKDVPIVSINHVGSTSVPGLIAKPVLDIHIVVTASNLFSARQALVAAGYADCGEMGIPDRYAMREPGFSQSQVAGTGAGTGVQEGMRRNTYVVLDGSTSLRNVMDLKRMLLADEALRVEYGNVKRKLVEAGIEDVNVYCKGKTECILGILRKAGWGEEELEEVRSANL